MSNLQSFQVTDSSSNLGISCAPLCLSSVPSGNLFVPSTVCVYPQDYGLCGLIAATNIQSTSGYGQWSCSNLGYTSTNPCAVPVWPGLSCNGINAVSINFGSVGITGNLYIRILLKAILELFIGTIPSNIDLITGLSYLWLNGNSLNGMLLQYTLLRAILLCIL